MFSEYILDQSISDSNMTEKNLMLRKSKSVLRKNMKSCQKKSSLKISCRKNSQKLKKLLILIAPTNIHIERFAGCVSDWIILNND